MFPEVPGSIDLQVFVQLESRASALNTGPSEHIQVFDEGVVCPDFAGRFR